MSHTSNSKNSPCRVVDIVHHRMEGVLAAMESVKLAALPVKAPWTLELLLQNTCSTCCQAAHVRGG